MNRNLLVLTAVALASTLAGAAVFHLLQPDLAEITTAPIELHSIPLTDIDGRASTIADWRGDILVVNFWAPWCVPCRREIPALIELQREFAQRGVKVLGIAFDGEAPVRRFAAEYAINYPLFLGANRIPMYNAAFGNSSGALPFTALLDRQQQIRNTHLGEVSPEQLRKWLTALL